VNERWRVHSVTSKCVRTGVALLCGRFGGQPDLRLRLAANARVTSSIRIFAGNAEKRGWLIQSEQCRRCVCSRSRAGEKCRAVSTIWTKARFLAFAKAGHRPLRTSYCRPFFLSSRSLPLLAARAGRSSTAVLRDHCTFPPDGMPLG